jgi:hypothetical protein
MLDHTTRIEAALEGFAKRIVVVLAVFTTLLVLSKFAHITFRHFAFISSTICFLAFLLPSLKTNINHEISPDQSTKTKEPRWALSNPGIYLIIAIIIAGLSTSAINAPEEDDSFYASPVVHSIANPHESLDININWLAPWPDGSPVTATGMEYTEAYPYFVGVISYLTKIDFLFLYQVIGTFFWGAALYIANYIFIRKFSTARSSVFGAMLIFILCLFVFRDGASGYGIFLSKLSIGKTIVMYVFIPFFASIVYDYYKHSNINNWLYVLAATIASIAFSLSSLFLIPAALTSITGGVILCALIKKEFRTSINLLLLAPALFVVIVVALDLRSEMGQSLTNSAQQLLGVSSTSSLFLNTYKSLFGEIFSTPTLIIAFATIYLLFFRSKYAFTLSWFAFGLVVFVNPLTEAMISKYLTSTLVYGRIFMILPWLLLVGLAGADIYERATQVIGKLTVSITLFIVLVICIPFYVSKSNNLILRNPNNAYFLGIPQFVSTPRLRIDPEIKLDVEQIIATLPPGNTLSTMSYSLAIPMFSGIHPQYYSNPYSAVLIYGRGKDSQADRQLRYKAIQYLFGGMESKSEFELLLNDNVKNIVVDSTINNNMDIEAIATKYGFSVVIKSHRFVAYTRASQNRL